MKIRWVTDIHVDFLMKSERELFFQSIEMEDPDVVFVTGDTCEAPHLVDHLTTMANIVRKPIYFVLGNHDFYRSDVKEVRDMMIELTSPDSPTFNEFLTYLPAQWLIGNGGSSLYQLSEKVGLLGCDGWGDCSVGNVNTPVVLNDSRYIRDFSNVPRAHWAGTQRKFGKEAADFIRDTLPDALKKYDTVVFLTHVPPFEEATWHQGKRSDRDFLPHFCCGQSGEALREIMEINPDKKLVVLCGHTHSDGIADILPNLRVYTGGNEYNHPIIQPITLAELF